MEAKYDLHNLRISLLYNLMTFFMFHFREKISFGLKFNQGGAKGENASKPNKIILNSGTSSLLSTKSLGSTSSSSSGKASSSTLSSNNVKSVSSLVPYHDDSEDSELDDAKQSGIVNGVKEKLAQNPTAKSEDTAKAKDRNDKGAKLLHNHKQDKVNSSSVKSSHSENDGNKSSSLNSNCNSKSGALSSVPFVPRSLQIVNGASPVNTCTSSSSSSSNSSSSNNKTKGEKGWLVTDNSLHSPSESSSGSVGGTGAFTVVEQPTSCKEKQAVGHEKMDNHGWTVTIRKQRPELEKSHSHDSVLPGPSHRKDEADSASLRSKASVDSTRSDRSTKSMKKSIFSLFTCVSSARSPDSPEEEQPEASHPQENAVPETKSRATENDHKAKNSDAKADKSKPSTSNSLPNAVKSKKGVVTEVKSKITACNGQSNLKSDSESDNEILQSKRFRDHDDEPSSPSKKCRPEEAKNASGKKGESEPTKNGSSSAPKNGVNSSSKNLISSDNDKSKNRDSHELSKSKNGLEEIGKKCKKKKKHKKTKSLCNGLESDDKSQEDKEECSSSVLHSSGLPSSSESSDSDDDQEETDRNKEKTKDIVGYAKVNHSAQVIHWDGMRKMNGDVARQQLENGNGLGRMNGERSSLVTSHLLEAGNFAFGTKGKNQYKYAWFLVVNPWSQGLLFMVQKMAITSYILVF